MIIKTNNGGKHSVSLEVKYDVVITENGNTKRLSFDSVRQANIIYEDMVAYYIAEYGAEP